ncbi:hypothetical protein HYT58_02250 [Candidatus Woesearchaeota archaeon]|nr:hypothetical protein [Candidatus Woesearchaeota archaeon]
MIKNKKGLNMKKGQTTTFVILGIVVLGIIFLLLYFKQGFYFGPVTPEDLESRFESISEHIQGCVNKVAPDYIKRIGMQGGHLKTPQDTYRLHQGIPVSYLCYSVKGTPKCYNRLLLISDMENELNLAIKEGLTTCVNIKQFARGLDVTYNTLSVDTKIGKDVTLVDINIPITLKRGDVEVKEDKFSVKFDVPLGRLYGVAQEIINIESEFGEFEQLSYMIVKRGQFVIEKTRPYPDKLYVLRTKDNDYKFQFFVEGEPT